MSPVFEITYKNECGLECKATIVGKEYYYWSHSRDRLTGKFYKVYKTLLGKFLSKMKNCTNVRVKEISQSVK